VTSRRRLFGDGSDEGFAVKPRKAPDADLDITPMIDVTFLLLIFFMVTSTMQGTPDVEVPPAKHGVGVDTMRATVITVKRPEVPDGRPTIILGDGRGPEGDLEAVREFVERRRAQDVTQVIIKADRDVQHGYVQEVARVVSAIDGVRFSIGVQDKRE
jgi:biopolymer transport protein ExbD